MKKVQITIYDITGETDPVILDNSFDYKVRRFNKSLKRKKQ